MNRLALTAALASAALGSGCVVKTAEPTGDLDLAWQFVNSQGTVAGSFTPGNTGCTLAAIADVHLTISDARGHTVLSQDFPCVETAATGYPRAYVAGLRAGSYSYLATAYRSGSAVFEDGGTFDVFDSTTTQVDATLTVLTPAPLTVYFTQQGSATCSGTPQIRYDLFNAPGTTLLETKTFACPASTGFTVTADWPVGVTYQFDIYAMTAGSPPASVNERCLQNVLHTGFPETINLIAAPDPSCG